MGLLINQTDIYITTPKTEVIHGQSITKYINLRKIRANLQYLSNADEQREFGTVTNSVIVVRIDTLTDKDIVNSITPKDGIYLDEPQPNYLEIDTGDNEPVTIAEYPDPDYIIISKKSANVAPINSIRNPVTITAKLNEGKRRND